MKLSEVRPGINRLVLVQTTGGERFAARPARVGILSAAIYWEICGIEGHLRKADPTDKWKYWEWTDDPVDGLCRTVEGKKP